MTYQTAMKLNMSKHWVAVQYLCLTAVLHAAKKLKLTYKDEIWTTVKVSCEFDLDATSLEDRAWAHCSLCELYLLQVLNQQDEKEAENATQKVLYHTSAVLEIAPSNPFIIYSTRRQLLRYVDWWSGYFGESSSRIIKVAKDALKIFDA